MLPSLPFAAARAADDSPAVTAVAFTVQARAEPGVMPRVAELFAKRGLVPQQWHSTASGALLTIDVQMAGIEHELGDYIARCMRQIVGVEAVLTSDC